MPGQAKDTERGQLYTVVMEFEGTTSVSQFMASCAREAFQRWLEGLSGHATYGLTNDQVSRLAKGVGTCVNEDPSPIAGLQNVWCAEVLANRRGMALLNIVGTCPLRIT